MNNQYANYNMMPNKNVDTYNMQNPEYIKDYGANPFVANLSKMALQNNTFRTAVWTGKYFQITLMSIPVGESIGLELHEDTDQFLMIEQGIGVIKMGDTENSLNLEEQVYPNISIVVPAGKWHNLINIGNVPLKIFSIYAPPHHPKGTVHVTKEDMVH